MIHPILKYGEEILHRPAETVLEITKKVNKLIDDMIETMYAAQGIGLAAPQIGVPLNIFVVDISAGRNPHDLIVMINPSLMVATGTQSKEEGCLSVPGFNVSLERPAQIKLKGVDRNGRELQFEAKDLLARAFQHEIDHLDGKIFIDRLRGVKRDLIVRRIYKLQRQKKW